MRRGQLYSLLFILILILIIFTMFFYLQLFKSNSVVKDTSISLVSKTQRVESFSTYSLDFFNFSLRWTNIRKSESARQIYWRLCSGKYNVGDINVLIKPKHICFGSKCPVLSCTPKIIKGENKGFHNDYSSRFSVDTKKLTRQIQETIAFNQRLEFEHEIEICCSADNELVFCRNLKLDGNC